MKKADKMFIVRKYVMADSVSQALKKEKTTEVHEVYVDDEWKKNNLAQAIGFVTKE